MARTKAVNKPKPAQCAQTNGTPKTAGPPPTAFKSPAQTAELTEAERNKLKQWLDTNDKSFKVATVPLSHKRKRDAPALPVQTDLFEDRLNVQYEVKPGKQWTQLRKYKKFTGTSTRNEASRDMELEALGGAVANTVQWARIASRRASVYLFTTANRTRQRLNPISNGRPRCWKSARSTPSTSTSESRG